MTADRKAVRATPQFFEDLDRQLAPERGLSGEPSVHDFQVFELLRIVDQFAVGFAEMPELIVGRSNYRILITSGVLVPRLSVIGQLAPDGAVELIRLHLDLQASD